MDLLKQKQLQFITKMNKKEQQLFVAFFQEIYEAEQEIEEIKKKLNSCRNFNPYLLFQHIVRDGEPDDYQADADTIQITKLRQYLADRSTCNQRQLYELFEKFDKERNGQITIEDFVRELTPLGSDGPHPKTQGTVNPQIEGHFLALINEILKRFRILEVLRKQVSFIWPYNAFAEIDNFKTGYIGLGQLQSFLDRNDYQITQRQLGLLLYGLRRRCYHEVNLEVFCENIQPLEFGEYEAYKLRVDEENERQFLNRSRREQETMRRSRIESWKIDHNIAKQQRRRRAEKQRELQLEERINNQIKQHEKQKERYIRRAMLEQDKNIRWNVQTGGHVLQLQKQRQMEFKLHNQDLGLIRNQQSDVKNCLVKNALLREDDLENSRRARYNLERERQIQQQLEYQRQLERRQLSAQREYQREMERRQAELERQRVINEDIERQREFQRRQYAARERALSGEYGRGKFIAEAEASRRIYQQQIRRQRQLAERQYELERIRSQQRQRPYDNYEPTSNSRRLADLSRELDKTRAEILERQSRINLTGSKRQPETADRDYRDWVYRS